MMEGVREFSLSSIASGRHCIGVIKEDGSLWMWGSDYYGQIGDGMWSAEDRLTPVKVLDNVKAMGFSYSYSAALKEDGSLWMWGCNRYGQLGDGTTENRLAPIKVLENVKEFRLRREYSSYEVTGALKEDGSLWMWGSNQYGQIGDGTWTAGNMSVPVKILENVKKFDFDEEYCGALKEDGSLWMWGSNWYGQIGDRTTKNRNTPVKIMEDVKEVCLSGFHSAVIAEDGSLWMWGRNQYGELGDGTTEDRNTPVKIMEEVKEVSLGSHHSAAIKEDGSLWMWGHNANGQLGDGTEEDRNTPVRIIEDVKEVCLGGYHSAVIAEDGSLWMWGNNFRCQIGDGTEEDRNTPVRIMEGVKEVCLGVYHNAAIAEDGSLWMWGGNLKGQIGDGTEGDRCNPVQILPKVPFEDIKADDWYYDSVTYVNRKGLMTGLNATTFAPEQPLARAQFAVILHRINGEPKMEYTDRFKDVPEGEWYTDAVLWAASNGIVNGYDDTGLFGTADNINREQMAVMMYRYAKYKGYDISKQADFSRFTDAASVSGFASDAMKWAVGNEIITGKNGTMLDPQGNAIRAECATIIMRFVKKYE